MLERRSLLLEQEGRRVGWLVVRSWFYCCQYNRHKGNHTASRCSHSRLATPGLCCCAVHPTFLDITVAFPRPSMLRRPHALLVSAIPPSFTARKYSPNAHLTFLCSLSFSDAARWPVPDLHFRRSVPVAARKVTPCYTCPPPTPLQRAAAGQGAQGFQEFLRAQTEGVQVERERSGGQRQTRCGGRGQQQQREPGGREWRSRQ